MSDLKLQQSQKTQEFMGITIQIQKSGAYILSPGASKLSTVLGGLLAATPAVQEAWNTERALKFHEKASPFL